MAYLTVTPEMVKSLIPVSDEIQCYKYNRKNTFSSMCLNFEVITHYIDNSRFFFVRNSIEHANEGFQTAMELSTGSIFLLPITKHALTAMMTLHHA